MSNAATKTRKDRTFSRESYVDRLMAELNHAEICQRIALARKQAGFKQRQLAEALTPPMSYRTVQSWESVKNPVVPWDRLDELARLTKVTKEWLLHGDDWISPNDGAVIREEMAEVRAMLAEVLDEVRRPTP